MYEITKWPKDCTRDRENSGELFFDVKLYQGGATQGKLIYDERIKISRDMEPDFNHIIQINFAKAVKLETQQSYTITMKPNKECISYYGFNGSYSTNDFVFQDTIFTKNIVSNSTGILHGQFPVFYFEE